MARYGVGDITDTSFTVYAHSFSGDLTRFLQIVINGRVRHSSSIEDWNDYYYGERTFTGLSPGTDYEIDFYVGYSTVYSNNDLMETLYVTTESPPLNEAFYAIDAWLELDSYDSNTGYAYITAYVDFYNPNSVEAYGRGSIYIYDDDTEGSTYTSSNRWVDAYDTFTVSKQYYWYIGGAFPRDFTIRGNGACYEEQYATSGSMATSGYITFYDDLELSRPSKFYWINSSTSLSKGANISDYITASKWSALQTNVNGVRAYKGYKAYSFTTVSKNSTITAALYNQVANAINGIRSGTVSTVSKGDVITASVMMALQNGINGIS